MYQQHLYKQQLYNTLANDNNLVDNVKLQLRQKIINKLRSTQSANTNRIQPDKQLIKKICTSLFVEYLNHQRLFHTLAVFSPQSGFSKNIFTPEDLQQLFKLNSPNTSTLQCVINTFLPKGRLYERTVETSIQTDDKETIQNLQNKLAHIDFQYKKKAIQGLKSVQDSQQRFLKYKNQLNKRYKSDLDQQIKRIRDFEIANVRIDQQQKQRIKTRQYQQQLELNYRSKMEKLRQRQSQVMNRVANKMKQVQTYNYEARQKMLKDFQSIKARQQELQRFKDVLLERERKLIKQNKV